MNHGGEKGMRGYLGRKMWDLDSKNAETVENMTQDQIAERIKALATNLEPDELREVTTDLAGTMTEANQVQYTPCNPTFHAPLIHPSLPRTSHTPLLPLLSVQDGRAATRGHGRRQDQDRR
jgi:hypothetical protein